MLAAVELPDPFGVAHRGVANVDSPRVTGRPGPARKRVAREVDRSCQLHLRVAKEAKATGEHPLGGFNRAGRAGPVADDEALGAVPGEEAVRGPRRGAPGDPVEARLPRVPPERGHRPPGEIVEAVSGGAREARGD